MLCDWQSGNQGTVNEYASQNWGSSLVYWNTKVALALHKQHRADMSQFVDTDTWPDILGRKT